MIHPKINHEFLTIITIVVVLSLSACRPSGQNKMTELEMQKEQWSAEYREAFPDRTQDTVEMRKRLEYFLGTGNKIGQLMMYRVLGNEARNSSQFRMAIEHHSQGLQVAYEINDTLNITVVMNDLATDFRRIGAFDEAAPYHYLALQIAEAYSGPDTLLNERNMASAYNGIGSICRAMNEYDEAIRIYRKALELEIQHNNFRGIAINYANIGAIHFDREEYAEAEENYIVSLEHNEKAKLPMGIALCRINIGNIYEVKGNLDSALEEYEQAYSILAGTSDKWHWLDACFQVANMHIRKGNLAAASRYLAEGMKTARGINSLKHIQKAHELYSAYNYECGDFKRSIEDMRLGQTYADTLRRNLEADRLLESRVKYETEKFSRQIGELDRLNREQMVKRRNTMLLLIPAIAVLIALLLLLLYKRRLERRQATELKNLERMRSNFFTNITHEFRTPITVIDGLSSHLQSSVKDAGSPEARDLDAIRRQGRHLMYLVNQLLDFSRSEAGVNRPKWRHGDIVEYLHVIVEPYMQYARSKSVELFIYSETDSLPINFVPSSIKKVMGNLLSNALKHCGAGNKVVVHFRYDPETKHCSIQVKDSGEGIAPENLPHIFELYYTAESGKSGISSSGIGLALSKQLIEEIGGAITVTSTLGKGTEFTVSLPFSDALIPEDEWEVSDEEDSEVLGIHSEDDEENLDLPAGVTSSKKTILIVEDNKDVAHYISTILAKKYALLHASNGNEGLLIAEQHIPDLIITDVMMPEKDGYTFTADLRASVAVSHIPVIMITAKSTTEDKLEGLKAGVDAYLSKPFDERELLARIKQLLDSRAMLIEAYVNALLHGNKNKPVDTGHNMAFITKLSTVVNNHLDDDTYFPGGLANDMCLSESQLNRKLKAMTGHTITSFVMHVRLNKAKQILSRRDRSIKEVAFACGFSNLNYFSRSFRKAFGYTPSQFLNIPEQQNPKE